MKQYALVIQEIRKETKDSVTLCFKQPGLRKINYLAGQYITLIFRISGKRYSRPYSFSSAPSVDVALEVTVKRVQNGIVSNYINDELRVGDIVEVLEPMGNFTIRNSSKQPIFLWGAGSGITPLFSIIKELLITQQDKKVHLIYSNSNKESSIFREQLIRLQDRFSSFFTLTLIYSSVDSTLVNGCEKVGRISHDYILELFSNRELIDISTHYICGPKSLKESIYSSLVNLGVPSCSINVEDYSLDFAQLNLDGIRESKVAIFDRGEVYDIFVPKGKDILNVALDNGLMIPYACQVGNCNSCKVLLRKGQLKVMGSAESRQNLKPDEYLLCCSFPLTSEVFLELI